MTSLFTSLIQRFQAVFYRTDHITTGSANAVSDVETWDFSLITTIDLSVDIDGGGSQTITLEAALLADSSSATAAELVIQINTQLTGGVAVDDSKGRIVIATSTMGDSGSVEIGGAAGTLLGFRTDEVSGGAYDDVWGAPLPQADNTQEGEDTRRELAPVTIECQIDRADWGTRRLTAGGEEEKADGILTLKKDDLASAGLLGSDGLPVLHIGDRLDRILQLDDVLAIQFPYPPGMWVQKVEPAGFGLAYFGTPEVNLFYIHCSKDRHVEGA
jgi:hypothetical protein